MVELPRAALTAHRIAETAEFFSFGTNDLTQTTWGFSRDDVEAEFFAAYLDKGVFTQSPFESLDIDGVGRLVEIAVREGRDPPEPPPRRLWRARRRPDSIHFFDGVGWTTSPAHPSGSRRTARGRPRRAGLLHGR